MDTGDSRISQRPLLDRTRSGKGVCQVYCPRSFIGEMLYEPIKASGNGVIDSQNSPAPLLCTSDLSIPLNALLKVRTLNNSSNLDSTYWCCSELLLLSDLTDGNEQHWQAQRICFINNINNGFTAMQVKLIKAPVPPYRRGKLTLPYFTVVFRGLISL